MVIVTGLSPLASASSANRILDVTTINSRVLIMEVKI